MVNSVYQWMISTSIPQLFFYTKPAAFFSEKRMGDFLESSKNVTTHFLGKGIYNHLEDYPKEIGSAFTTWLKTIN